MNRHYQPNPYALSEGETYNETPLTSVIVEESLSDVVSALFDLAESAQQKIQDDPENIELLDYSHSLTWHYSFLRKDKLLAPFIKEAKEKYKAVNELELLFPILQAKFESLVEKIQDLQKFVNEKPPHVWPEHFRDPNTHDLKQGRLSPRHVAGFAPNSDPDSISLKEWLTCVEALLSDAPLTDRTAYPRFNYQAKPELRLEFVEACSALLPEVEELSNLELQISRIDQCDLEMKEAQSRLQSKWNKARDYRRFPAGLGNEVQTLIQKKKSSNAAV